MKENVFNQYVDKVINLFGISRDDLFSKSKKRNLVDARQLLYYLCSKRNIQVTYIQKYILENGYDTVHSTIIHGIAVVESKVKEDRDYESIVNSINLSVFISN
jgi:chromosomal replication initiator protein